MLLCPQKQRIRNIIAPSQDLGHSDKPVKAKPAAVVNDTPSAPASDNPRPAAPGASVTDAAGSGTAGDVRHEEERKPGQLLASDFEPRFRCG